MKKLLILFTFFLFLTQFQIAYSQFSSDEVDKIIDGKVWCITDIKVNGESKGADGKWMFISGMNLVSGDDDRLDDVTDIINKKHTEFGIVITYLDKRSERLIKLNLTINENKTHPDSNEYSYKANTYVELIGSMENQPVELRLSCTSLIHGESSTTKLPSRNWDGNK